MSLEKETFEEGGFDYEPSKVRTIYTIHKYSKNKNKNKNPEVLSKFKGRDFVKEYIIENEAYVQGQEDKERGRISSVSDASRLRRLKEQAGLRTDTYIPRNIRESRYIDCIDKFKEIVKDYTSLESKKDTILDLPYIEADPNYLYGSFFTMFQTSNTNINKFLDISPTCWLIYYFTDKVIDDNKKLDFQDKYNSLIETYQEFLFTYDEKSSNNPTEFINIITTADSNFKEYLKSAEFGYSSQNIYTCDKEQSSKETIKDSTIEHKNAAYIKVETKENNYIYNKYNISDIFTEKGVEIQIKDRNKLPSYITDYADIKKCFINPSMYKQYKFNLTLPKSTILFVVNDLELGKEKVKIDTEETKLENGFVKIKPVSFIGYSKDIDSYYVIIIQENTFRFINKLKNEIVSSANLKNDNLNVKFALYSLKHKNISSSSSLPEIGKLFKCGKEEYIFLGTEIKKGEKLQYKVRDKSGNEITINPKICIEPDSSSSSSSDKARFEAIKKIQDIDKDITTNILKGTKRDSNNISPDNFGTGLQLGPFQSVKTSSNGDCFVHAVLQSVSSLFRKLTDNEKNEYAKWFRYEFCPYVCSVYLELENKKPEWDKAKDAIPVAEQNKYKDIDNIQFLNEAISNFKGTIIPNKFPTKFIEISTGEILSKYFEINFGIYGYYGDRKVQDRVGFIETDTAGFTNQDLNSPYILLYNPDDVHYRTIGELVYNAKSKYISLQYIFSRKEYDAILKAYGVNEAKIPNFCTDIDVKTKVRYIGENEEVDISGKKYEVKKNSEYTISKIFFAFETNECNYFEFEGNPGWAIAKNKVEIIGGGSVTLESILDKYKDLSIVENRIKGKSLAVPDIITMIEEAIIAGNGQIKDLKTRLAGKRVKDKKSIQDNITKSEELIKRTQDLLNEIKAL